MPHLIPEIILPEGQYFLPPFPNEHLSRNTSIICLICGSLWAQIRYHYLGPEQQLTSFPLWHSVESVCPAHCQGGSVLEYATRWVPNVRPYEQPVSRELILREIDLILDHTKDFSK